jgi:hypothetical protein
MPVSAGVARAFVWRRAAEDPRSAICEADLAHGAETCVPVGVRKPGPALPFGSFCPEAEADIGHFCCRAELPPQAVMHLVGHA